MLKNKKFKDKLKKIFLLFKDKLNKLKKHINKWKKLKLLKSKEKWEEKEKDEQYL